MRVVPHEEMRSSPNLTVELYGAREYGGSLAVCDTECRSFLFPVSRLASRVSTKVLRVTARFTAIRPFPRGADGIAWICHFATYSRRASLPA